MFFFFFFKQKTAYEMRISDWSSDVCSSDLTGPSWKARTCLLLRSKDNELSSGKPLSASRIMRSSEGQSIFGTEKLLTQVPSFDGAVAASVVAGSGPQPQDLSQEVMTRLSYRRSE